MRRLVKQTEEEFWPNYAEFWKEWCEDWLLDRRTGDGGDAERENERKKQIPAGCFLPNYHNQENYMIRSSAENQYQIILIFIYIYSISMFAFHHHHLLPHLPPQFSIIAEKSFSIMLIPPTPPVCLPACLLFPFLGKKHFSGFLQFLIQSLAAAGIKATSSGVKQIPAFIHSLAVLKCWNQFC